jgi:predicted AlkP superfamily pyrophosphatase or phosphodiesterase
MSPHNAPAFRPARRLAVLLCLAATTTPLVADGAGARPSPSLRQVFLERFARAYFPGRTGQIALVPREGHILTRRDPAYAFMHGSPWPYDTRIPFLIHGPAFVRAGTFPEPVAQQDMAPTLASILGVTMPATSVGRARRTILKPAATRPRLIVLAVLDGMRVDYFDRYARVMPTLGRLRRQGGWFSNARVNYLPSITSLGHATLATGADPRIHGIVANSVFDVTAGQPVDIYSGPSPRNLMALTLADVWSIHTDGRAVIIGQGSIARAALPLAGHGSCVLNGRAVIASMYSEKTGRWETGSDCYRLPEYLKDRDSKGLWEATDGTWMGHPIAGPREVRGSALFSRFETEALRLLIEHEPLGADEVTDLLFVNLKTPDYVGHRYGPDSPEMREALAGLDRDLTTVIDALEAKVGRDRYVLAISADHGMPPEPDERLGRRRVYTDDIVKLIHEKLDPEQGRLVRHNEAESAQLAVDRGRLRELGLDLDAIRKLLEAQPYIFAAYTEDELARASAALR